MAELWRRFSMVVRAGFSGIAFLSFGLGGLLLGTLIVPIVLWRHRRAPRFERAAACQRWVQRAFVFFHDYMRVTTLINYQPRTVDTRTPGPRFVLIANHPTLVDVTALAAAFGRMTCIAKTPILKSPLVGPLVRACGYIDGGSGDVVAGAAVIPQALDRLAADMPVAIFPEGTRSPRDGLNRFRRGAFEIACRANVPVLPILIRCDPPALGKGRPWYDVPPRSSDFTLTPLPVMHPADFGGSAVEMASAAEALYRKQLNL
jgi:1-acyl-sn-glycerol-3-phosphate acyltransferase